MECFQAARTHMVDCQIRTNGVVDAKILDAFEYTPREVFISTDKRNVAYTDKPLIVEEGRVLMDPMVHARLLSALALRPSDVVLDIGASSGYSCAILSSMVTTVIALESRQATIDKATKKLNDMGVCNVAYVKGRLIDGAPQHAPFDAIVFNGAVAKIPEEIIDQLCVGGRLVAVVKSGENSIGQAMLLQKRDGGHVSRSILFEASLPYLAGFEPQEEFVF